jgi:hypothetical protein
MPSIQVALIGWVLLIATVAALGYFSWQRYHNGDTPRADNAQRVHRPGSLSSSKSPPSKGRFVI